MSWKDKIRKERVSEERRDRMRALPSSIMILIKQIHLIKCMMQ